MEYHEFSNEAVSAALAAAQSHNEMLGVSAAELTGPEAAKADVKMLAGGEYSVLAQCISIKVSNHRICLKLPLGIGSICLPLPVNIPNGTAAQACLSICTTWGFPTGVKVRISALGHTIVTKSFGKC